MVLVASFVLGCLTSFAQGLLPEWLSSFANSASGWTLLTAFLVWWAGTRWWIAAPLGAASFVLLTVGYAVVSTLRGFPYDPMLFAVVGVIVGPFVGVAAVWLRERDVRAALATAALSGVAVGEAGYGLTVIADTTSPVYWILIGAVGIGLCVAMLARRIRGAWPVAFTVLGTAGIAVLFNIQYVSLGML